MLLNFCDPSLKPLIKSDKVSFDDHEVTNLISTDPSTRQRGFISDHFIKPPVNITVQFPCNIIIYHIVIDPVIGQQKSCDIKLFTATQNITESWLYGKEQTSVKSDSLLFSCVGNVIQNEPTVVCFENTLFRRKDLNIDINDRSFPCKTTLHGRKPGSLTNVSHLTVCIQRTKGGKAVAIRSLEVLGIPSGKVPYSIQTKLKTVYSETLHRQGNKTVSVGAEITAGGKGRDSDADQHMKMSRDVGDQMIQNGIEIPEDFLDQITYDIMTVPVMLPSGKNIDQQTLDKFINTEASWGRGPSDPYTGLSFTQHSHPVVNSSLKARIDRFVLEHSDVLSVPRTLGSAESNAGNTCKTNRLKSSRLLSNTGTTFGCRANGNINVNGKACTNNTNITDVANKFSVDNSGTLCVEKIKSVCNTDSTLTSEWTNIGIPSSNNVYDKIYQKRKLTWIDESELNIPKSFKFESKGDVKVGLKTMTISKQDMSQRDDRLPVSLNTAIVESDKGLKTHSANLALSLDSALSAALVGLPSFSRKTQTSYNSNSDKQDNRTKCCKCEIFLQDAEIVKYQLPCSHLVCRNCLKETGTDILCKTCDQSCKSSQVIRIF